MEDLNKLIEDKIKNSITGPDYNKRESITFTNKSYTVQEDGYIQVYFKYLSGVNAGSGVQDFLRINNVIVFANNASVNWQNPWSPIFLVKKGDLISYSATAQEITGFYFPIR